MKILIATPLFPPDVGGPATYTFNLAKGLSKKAVAVLVITYSNSLNLSWQRAEAGFEKIEVPLAGSKLLRSFIYFRELMQNSRDTDVVYAHDLGSVGAMAFLTSIFLRKKLFLRLGGDSLWERAIESGKSRNPLLDFYQNKENKQFFLSQLLQDIILRVCDKIIFSSVFLKDIFIKYRGVSPEKSAVIENPNQITPAGEQAPYGAGSQPANQLTILFAGRLAKCKNLDRLLKVFSRLQRQDPSLRLQIIGEGPLLGELVHLSTELGLKEKVKFLGVQNQESLFCFIKEAYLCCLISLSEVSPNFALECLSLKKPLVITKHNGLPESIKSKLIMVDPQDEKDILNAFTRLFNKENYQNYCQDIARLQLDRTWGNVVNEHIKLFVYENN